MKKEDLAGMGTIVASLLASSCCIGPAVFIISGTSIGFLGSFSKLMPLKPYLLVSALLMLGYSFWRLYLKRPECVCAENRRIRMISRIIFWIGLMSFAFAILFQKIVLWIYG
jgi:mercuric ion transport protein